MCPDKQMLSVYFDGEMPSPWKEKLEDHIVTCSQCQNQLAAYKTLNAAVCLPEDRADEDALMEKSKARIFDSIDARRKNLVFKPHNFMARSIEIPVPFVAAAAAVLVLAVSLLITQRPPTSNAAAIPAVAVSPTPGAANDFIVPTGFEIDEPTSPIVSSMSDVLRYLEKDDSNDIVIIKLPERNSFIRSGEPLMINAAQYSGGKSR